MNSTHISTSGAILLQVLRQFYVRLNWNTCWRKCMSKWCFRYRQKLGFKVFSPFQIFWCNRDRNKNWLTWKWNWFMWKWPKWCRLPILNDWYERFKDGEIWRNDVNRVGVSLLTNPTTNDTQNNTPISGKKNEMK